MLPVMEEGKEKDSAISSEDRICLVVLHSSETGALSSVICNVFGAQGHYGN